jgi:DNA-binding transcriptional LysR family regulator
MPADPIPWELYRSFLAVARHGSLSGAARALRLTQPTLGRHVDQLEQALGTPMFTRSPQGLIPTETALTLVPIAEAMESAAEAMVRAASGQGDAIAGVVRITASQSVGAEVLPGILADFAERHPLIAFELNLSNRAEDLLRRDADIAVRMLRPTQTGLVARWLGETVLGLYAHRRYLERTRRPETIVDLAGLRLIGFDRDPVPVLKLKDGALPLSRDMFSLRTDNDLAQLAALRAGYGMGVCQVGIARRDPDLVRLLPEVIAVPLPTWLVMHEDLRANGRVRGVFDHLVGAMQDYLKTSG